MVATTTATTAAGTAAAVGASSAAAGTTAGVSAGIAAGTAAGVGTAASVGAGTATGAGIVAGTAGTATAGTAAATAGFGSWLHSMLFGEAASASASAAGAGTAGTAGASAAGAAGTGATATSAGASAGTAAAAGTGTGQTAAGTAASEGLIGAGGEYSTKSLLANAMTGASAASAVMSGISSSRQMKASQKQTEIQYHQEKNQALQKSNLIREAMLKDVASARATYASRGFTDDGTPSQAMNESANQANSDIGVVKTDSQIAGLQLRAQGQEYKRGAAFSLLSGFGNGARIVGNRILRK